MNRSVYMITFLAGVGFVGCGDTETSKSQRFDNETREDVIDLNVGYDSVEFSLLPPSDSEPSNESFSSKSLNQNAPDETPPPKPTEQPSSRISIKCKDRATAPTEGEEGSLVAGTPTFTIGLEESSADGSVSYERRSFSYLCGREGAMVSITNLSVEAKYALDATYANAKGVLTHKGNANFKIAQNSAIVVQLFMKRIKNSSGSVDVDVIFDKKPKPTGCKDIETICALIYAPVICEGTASPFDGREIALIIGPIKADNECTARVQLTEEACNQEAELQPNISCKPI